MSIERIQWERDTTPYLVFACLKCKQYIYVKTTQKSKKCLRCRRTYQVKFILDKGEIVYGVSEAVNRVKELQNTMGTSQFSAETEFAIASKKETRRSILQADEGFDHIFSNLLETLSTKYKEFPLYMIELMAQEYQIPPLELKILIRKAIQEKLLISTKKKSCYRYKAKFLYRHL